MVVKEDSNSDGRAFNLTVEAPIKGNWNRFVISDIEDISLSRQNTSSVRILDNDQSLPLEFELGSKKLSLNFAKFGTVYLVVVRSVSDFSLTSASSAIQFVLTSKLSLSFFKQHTTICIPH